jgi:hypothetical protein
LSPPADCIADNPELSLLDLSDDMDKLSFHSIVLVGLKRTSTLSGMAWRLRRK